VEVEAALCRAAGVTGALVFGVKVAGEEGRAGMAVLTVTGDFCPRALHAELAASLPAYARPVFLRIRARLETTGTFKPVKAALAREGFSQCGGDAVYIADAVAGTYRLLGGAEARLLSEGPRGYTVPPASTVSVMPVMLRA
jgi:fatty-acyl-CoA synthase